MMKPSRWWSCALLAIASCWLSAAAAGVVVVVSAKNPVAHLSAEQVTAIFLGKVSTFPNGNAATPLDQADGSAIRREFYSRVAHKTPSQLSAYWAKVIFTGDGQPPKLLPDQAAVLRELQHDASAIAYVDDSGLDGNVRVIFTP